MPEVQAINQLASTLQNSILATMAIVTLAVIGMMIWQIRSSNAQDKRQQDTVEQVFTSLKKALDNKEQLDKLGDGQDTELVILQSHQTVLNGLPGLIRDFKDAVEGFHGSQVQIREANLTTIQHLIDFMEEQGSRFDSLDTKVELMLDNDARLVILLERLNQNLETFNANMETFNRDISNIKAMVAKQITSEQPTVKSESEAPKTDAPEVKAE
jgi:hypothetical protein